MLTIYERNGGFPAIRSLISDFYEEALDSALIGHHFEQIDMPRLIDDEFVCSERGEFDVKGFGSRRLYSLDDEVERQH